MNTVQPAGEVRIVLVGTQHPGNIGSAARAIRTMGLERLVLVAPERYPHADASAMAAGADDVLAALKSNPKTEKGEYCLVLDFHAVTLPEEKAPAAEISLEAQLVEQLLSGADWRDAQAELVAAGAKKNAVKAAALRVKKLFEEDDE